jgi:hypothetical protein
MQFEMDTMRASTAHDATAPVAPTRKALREATDALMNDGLATGELVEAVTRACDVMCTVAAGLVRHGYEPGVADLVEATCASIENARAVLDKGLMLQDAATVNCGAVMVELTVRGMCAALGVPYDSALREVARASLAGEAPAIRPLLVAVGLATGDAIS